MKCYDCGLAYNTRTNIWHGYRAAFDIPGEEIAEVLDELVTTIYTVAGTARKDKEYHLEINYTLEEVEPRVMPKMQQIDD